MGLILIHLHRDDYAAADAAMQKALKLVEALCCCFIGLVVEHGGFLCNAIRDNVIKCNTMQYNVIKYNTMQYNVIQCNTMQYNAIKGNALKCNKKQCKVMQEKAIQCNAMQCNAMSYKHMATFWSIRYGDYAI